MSISVTFPDDVAAGLAAEAAKREMTPDALAIEIVAERLPALPAGKGRRLSFTAIGKSTSGRNAAEAEDMLAEGFGR